MCTPLRMPLSARKGTSVIWLVEGGQRQGVKTSENYGQVVRTSRDVMVRDGPDRWGRSYRENVSTLPFGRDNGESCNRLWLKTRCVAISQGWESRVWNRKNSQRYTQWECCLHWSRRSLAESSCPSFPPPATVRAMTTLKTRLTSAETSGVAGVAHVACLSSQTWRQLSLPKLNPCPPNGCHSQRYVSHYWRFVLAFCLLNKCFFLLLCGLYRQRKAPALKHADGSLHVSM